MARVGQMCLAQCLKTHHLKHIGTMESEREVCRNLVYSFEDNNKLARYSLDKILNCRTAIGCGMREGKWISVGEIAHCIADIHNGSPIKGYEELKFVPFTQGVLYF